MNFVKYLLAALALSCAVSSHADENKPLELAKVRTQLAVEYLRAGNLKTALDSANEAIAADLRYMSAYMVRGYIYDGKGRRQGGKRFPASAVDRAEQPGRQQ